MVFKTVKMETVRLHDAEDGYMMQCGESLHVCRDLTELHTSSHTLGKLPEISVPAWTGLVVNLC